MIIYAKSFNEGLDAARRVVEAKASINTAVATLKEDGGQYPHCNSSDREDGVSINWKRLPPNRTANFEVSLDERVGQICGLLFRSAKGTGCSVCYFSSEDDNPPCRLDDYLENPLRGFCTAHSRKDDTSRQWVLV